MPIPGLNEPLPFWDVMVDKQGRITDGSWTKYFEQVIMPQIRSATMITGKYSNGTTPLDDALTATFLEELIPTTGAYVVVAALQITKAAGVSSSVSLTLTWTSNGVVQSETFGPIANGGITNHLSVVYGILADGGTPVSIATTYAASPANDLHYNLAASLNINGLPGAVA